jgi:hypothetical protein
MEWSFNIESEVFVEFSLLWFTLIFINIDDVPKLMSLTMAVGYNNVLVFNILALINFH